MKICQIRHVIFESISQFSFKFYINLQCHQTYIFCTFLAQTLCTFFKRSLLKSTFLRHSSAQVKICQIVVPIFKRKFNSSSNFAPFFIVMIHKSSVNYKLMHFLHWIKGSHQSRNSETFECSGKNLPNSTCHFPNCKSGFLQITLQCHET